MPVIQNQTQLKSYCYDASALDKVELEKAVVLHEQYEEYVNVKLRTVLTFQQYLDHIGHQDIADKLK